MSYKCSAAKLFNKILLCFQSFTWKRYSDFNKLYKSMLSLHTALHRREEFPDFVRAQLFSENFVLYEPSVTYHCIFQDAATHIILQIFSFHFYSFVILTSVVTIVVCESNVHILVEQI